MVLAKGNAAPLNVFQNTAPLSGKWTSCRITNQVCEQSLLEIAKSYSKSKNTFERSNSNDS